MPTSTPTTTTTAATAEATVGSSQLAGSGRPATIAASLDRQRRYPAATVPSPTSTSASATAALPQRTPRSGAEVATATPPATGASPVRNQAGRVRSLASVNR